MSLRVNTIKSPFVTTTESNYYFLFTFGCNSRNPNAFQMNIFGWRARKSRFDKCVYSSILHEGIKILSSMVRNENRSSDGQVKFIAENAPKMNLSNSTGSWCPDASYLFFTPRRKWSIERFFSSLAQFSFWFHISQWYGNASKYRTEIPSKSGIFFFFISCQSQLAQWFHWMICKLKNWHVVSHSGKF